jgi:hypothetical protein
MITFITILKRGYYEEQNLHSAPRDGPLITTRSSLSSGTGRKSPAHRSAELNERK